MQIDIILSTIQYIVLYIQYTNFETIIFYKYFFVLYILIF